MTTELTPALEHLARLRILRDETVQRYELEPTDENGEQMATVIEAEEFLYRQVKDDILECLPPELHDVVTLQIGDLSKFLPKTVEPL